MGRPVVEPLGLKPQTLAVESPMFAPSCEFSSLISKVAVLNTPSKIVFLRCSTRLAGCKRRTYELTCHLRLVNLRQSGASFGPHLPIVTRTFRLISGLGL